MKLRGNQRGFSLIEVFVAMMILGGGIFVIANAWSGNFLRVRNSRINNTAASLIERKMTEIEVTYKDKPLEEIKEEDGGDFGAMYPGYRWEMSSKEFEMPDISGSLAAREGGADEMLLTIVKTLSEYVKQSVKEVTVTVAFKPKHGNEIRHAVTTYFVDYSKELQVPGGMPGAGGAPPPGGG
jgi:general secretion pathway protein I